MVIYLERRITLDPDPHKIISKSIRSQTKPRLLSRTIRDWFEDAKMMETRPATEMEAVEACI